MPDRNFNLQPPAYIQGRLRPSLPAGTVYDKMHLHLYGLCVQTYGELKLTITALQSENQTFPSIV